MTFNFPRWLSLHGVPFRQGARSYEILLLCPFCSERGKETGERFLLGVNYKTNLGHCFHCGWKSRKALDRLRAQWQLPEGVRFGGSSIDAEFPTTTNTAVELPSAFHLLSNVSTAKKKDISLDNQALTYLKQRGITHEQIVRYRIGVTYTGRFAYRVIFPVYYAKKLVGIVARDFTGKQKQRYLFHEGTKSLFNASPTATKVVFAEGVFKALRIAQILPPGWRAVAMLGNSITEEQEAQLPALRQAVVWADPDIIGKQAARRLTSYFHDRKIGVSLIVPRKPADDASLEELQAEYSGKQPYSELARWQAETNHVREFQFHTQGKHGGFTATPQV